MIYLSLTIKNRSLNNSKTSKTHSKAPSIDSNSLNNESWRGILEMNKRMYNNTSNITNTLNSAAKQHSSMYSSKESLTSITTTTNPSTNSLTKLKTNTVEESYSFSGVYHVFNNHTGAGKFEFSQSIRIKYLRIKF